MSLPEDDPTQPSAGPEPLRVFVVENHNDTRALLTLLMEQNGHLVQSASSVAEALERFAESRSQVLVADLGLPDGTGWELLERLRAEQPEPLVYAIAMSGFGSQADRNRSRAAGFRHHLVKPVEPGRLDALLDEARRERDAAP